MAVVREHLLPAGRVTRTAADCDCCRRLTDRWAAGDAAGKALARAEKLGWAVRWVPAGGGKDASRPRTERLSVLCPACVRRGVSP